MTKLFEAKPFIIAEIGSNWTTFDEAKDSISFAKAAGADAVKFQYFDSQALYGMSVYGNRGIDPNWLIRLREKAKACDIEFMCTAFSPADYDVIDQFVNVHKIASAELCYPQLLEKVKSKNKPIILSVGASSKSDITFALEILKPANVVLLYCASSYPSTMYNLFYMDDLKKTFDVPVGLSDHSLDVVYPALSAVHHFGAVVVEKHVNFTKHKTTADAGHSLNDEQFVYLCESLRGKRSFREFNPLPEEREMFMRHNRRLIAIRDIVVGEAFRYGENFGAFRSIRDEDKGISPFAWEYLVKSNGAKRAIKTGQGIGPGDF